MTCPQCGSASIIYGSPVMAYLPGEPYRALWRVDSCLRCGKRWTVNLPERPAK